MMWERRWRYYDVGRWRGILGVSKGERGGEGSYDERESGRIQ